MKTLVKFIFIAVFSIITAASCSEFDDSKLWEAINKNAQDIADLKERCRQMNEDIVKLRTIVSAIEDGDYITSISPLADGSGYAITMKKYGTIVIKNGDKGLDGSNGHDGENGKTPVISVAKDTDGVYYWTVNGEWLTDENGEKIRAVGADGKDGKDGKDGSNGNNGNDGTNGENGKTPRLTIIDGYWYLSYDGEHWEQLGKATGDDGLKGEDGDAFFSGVSIREGYVIFYLNDENRTELKLPFVTENKFSIQVDEAGTLIDKLPLDLCKTITQLKVSGNINRDDINYLLIRCTSLEILDLSEADADLQSSTETGSLGNISNSTITSIFLPSTTKKTINLSCYIGIQDIIANTSSSTFRAIFSEYSVIEHIIIPEGVQEIVMHSNSKISKYLVLPSSLNNFSYQLSSSGHFECSYIVIKSISPPSINSTSIMSDSRYMKVSKKVLVPRASINAYENSDWALLAEIAAMEDYGYNDD